MLYLEQCWIEGFKAGELFIRQCPYFGNSLEARNWRQGWLEGAAKCLGLKHVNAPNHLITETEHRSKEISHA